MDLGLQGKTAVVAASSKGLGFSVVKNLISEGSSVVMNCRSNHELELAAEEIKKPEKLKTFCGDVTRAEQCKELIEFAINQFGHLDILVSNCGGPDSGDFEDIRHDQWQTAINRSLMSHVYLIEAALPYLKQSDFPSILTITSFTVKKPLQNLLLSNTIRAAAIGLTKSLANEFGPLGIRVNSILPGWTLTGRVDQLMNELSNKKDTSKELEIEQITSSIPLRRMGTPEEFGIAATFLVSPSASYITGVMLSVDGGISEGLF
ncbi:SDR family oxidoreductase [candidate division KSB1 bacterium]|nr:SDR family oxidoreductase [candidate division KSB1 bacterium]